VRWPVLLKTQTVWGSIAKLTGASAWGACRVAAIATVFGLLATRPAFASPMTWQFTGETNASSSGSLATLFPGGTDISFTLTYDTDWASTPGFDGTYAFGSTTPTTQFGYSVSIGGQQFQWSRRGTVFMYVRPDGLTMDTSLSEMTLAGPPAGNSPQWFPVAFDVNIPWPLGSSGLPGAFPEAPTDSNFSLYMRSYGGLTCDSCGANGSVNGSFTSSAKIPTPSTLLLVGLGLTGLAAMRRRIKS
jgi:hypothetical protein